MKIAVLGGTGPLGVFFCQEALKRGHGLVIYARNPSKLPKDVADNDNVKIIEGQLDDDKLLNSAIEGTDAVFSALGPSPSPGTMSIPSGLFTNPYRIVFKAMRKSGIKRILVLGTPSVTTPEDKQPLYVRFMITAIWMIVHSMWKEIVDVGKLLDDEAEDLDWTMYRVGVLSDDRGETIPAKYVGEGDWNFFTYRPDVATWAVDQFEKETAEFVHEKPSLYSKKAETT